MRTPVYEIRTTPAMLAESAIDRAVRVAAEAVASDPREADRPRGTRKIWSIR